MAICTQLWQDSYTQGSSLELSVLDDVTAFSQSAYSAWYKMGRLTRKIAA
jgi:hypothetical protein